MEVDNEISLRERIRLNLIDAMKNAEITQVQLADRLNISKGTVNNWTRGNNSPDVDMVPRICAVLGIPIIDLYSPRDSEPNVTASKTADPLLNISAEAKQIAQDYEKLSDHGKGAVRAILQYEGGGAEKKQEAPVRVHKVVKVIELSHAWDKASAGKGFDLSDGRMDTWQIVYNEDTRRADFCVDVDGRSMEPLYHNGDVLLIRRQPSVDMGEVGLFVVDGKGYVKRQAEDCLESINPEFPDIYPDEYSAVECMGKVIGILQDDWIVQA